MKLSIGFSPCPNDTFIFDALVNKKIDTEGMEFEVFMEDIETLNKWSTESKLDITKLSFPAFFKNLETYISLPSGAALGKGVGPLLVSNKDKYFEQTSIPENAIIAIPGVYTTANFLLSFSFPQSTNRIPVLFSDIENTVLESKADLGLLIHENRFTYEKRGLIKVADLGELWEKKTGLPIPLACIAIKREIGDELKNKAGRIIKKSLEYAFANYPVISDFVKDHAQAMEEVVMRQHIDLYVNNYSLDLGEGGQDAIQTLFKVYRKDHIVETTLPLFA